MNAKEFRQRAADARVLNREASEGANQEFQARLRAMPAYQHGVNRFRVSEVERALANAAEAGCSDLTFTATRSFRGYTDSDTHERRLALAAEALGEVDAASSWAQTRGFDVSEPSVYATHDHGVANGAVATIEIS